MKTSKVIQIWTTRTTMTIKRRKRRKVSKIAAMTTMMMSKTSDAIKRKSSR